MKNITKQVLGPIIEENFPQPFIQEDPDDEDPNQDLEEEEERIEFYVILLVVMIFFFLTAALNEKFKPRCGHQTGYAIILGVIFSCILYAAFGDTR